MLIEAGATGTQRDFFGEKPLGYAQPDSACRTMLKALEPVEEPPATTTGAAGSASSSGGDVPTMPVTGNAVAKDSPKQPRSAVV